MNHRREGAPPGRAPAHRPPGETGRHARPEPPRAAGNEWANRSDRSSRTEWGNRADRTGTGDWTGRSTGDRSASPRTNTPRTNTPRPGGTPTSPRRRATPPPAEPRTGSTQRTGATAPRTGSTPGTGSAPQAGAGPRTGANRAVGVARSTPTGGARGRATPARPGESARRDPRTGRPDTTGRTGTGRPDTTGRTGSGRYRAGGTGGTPPPDRGNRGTGTGPSGRPGGARRRRTKLTARGRRVLIFGVSFFVLVFGVVGVSAYVLVNKVTGNVSHLSDTFSGIDEKTRPAKPAAAKNSLTFLLVGSDSRDNKPTTGKQATDVAFKPGAQRTDSIMLMHIPDDRKSAQVVSIPRDSWVDIPDHGKMKINAAYALGGPPLLIRTIEKLTGVRIDHFAIVDFYGFKSIIDAIGGIDIEIPKTTRDIGGSGRTFQKGMNHFDGTRALDYVRQRHGLPAGDFDRVKRQQNMIRAVMSKVSKVDPTADPVQAYQLLEAMTKAITVDESLTESAMRSLAFGMRGVGAGGGVSFLTAPVTGTGTEGDQSVVYLDQTKTTDLWNGMNNDTMTAYLTAHQADLLPAVPR